MKPVVAITVGDYNGIGPEIALKCLRLRAIRRLCRPVLVGPEDVYARTARMLRTPLTLIPFQARRTGMRPADGTVEVVSVRRHGQFRPGRATAGAGRTAVAAIERATELIDTGQAEAMVTAPLSKKAAHRGGFSFPGQTELLLRLSGSRRVTMMMVCRALTIALVTIHEPLRRVPSLLTRRLLRETLQTVHASLVGDFRIARPRIAVLGLNPHAGEEGEIGTEERAVIGGTMRALARTGMRLEGPFPADGFFARYRPGQWDAVVAMYHDQGLIPFKLLARTGGVNFSAGLRIIRTSPAHGTAFDIAGRAAADPTSMAEAIGLAARLARIRRSHRPERQR